MGVYSNILLDKQSEIAVLTINRPHILNVLDRSTFWDIKQAVEETRDDPTIDVLIITGAGDKAFVAGADIAFMSKLTAMEAREFGKLGDEVTSLIESMPKLVIAAINGFCLGGGCELAMCCDLRISSDKGRFGQPEVRLGIIPGSGGTQRLPRLVGLGMARQLLYSGETIDAAEALRIGLVNRVIAGESLLEETLKIARAISSRCSQSAVRICKEAINHGIQVDINRALAHEADLFGLCFTTGDQKEGMNAFLEKRSPNFKVDQT